MPGTDEFSEDALDAVAAQVAGRLQRVLGERLKPTTRVAITSSLRVWELTADRIERDAAPDLAALAVPSARWQHQIAVDGEPALYARSTAPGPGVAPEVHEIVTSPVVARLDAAIDLADREGADDEVARLLEAVEYHVWALWLAGPQGRGRVVVVDGRFRTPFAPDGLRSDRELVERLRQTKPIVGVRPG